MLIVVVVMVVVLVLVLVMLVVVWSVFVCRGVDIDVRALLAACLLLLRPRLPLNETTDAHIGDNIPNLRHRTYNPNSIAPPHALPMLKPC